MKTMLSNHNAKRPWRAGLGLAAVLAGCGGGVGELLLVLGYAGAGGGDYFLDGDISTAKLDRVETCGPAANSTCQITLNVQGSAAVPFPNFLFDHRYGVSTTGTGVLGGSTRCDSNLGVTGTVDERRLDIPGCFTGNYKTVDEVVSDDGRSRLLFNYRADYEQGAWFDIRNDKYRLKFTATDDPDERRASGCEISDTVKTTLVELDYVDSDVDNGVFAAVREVRFSRPGAAQAEVWSAEMVGASGLRLTRGTQTLELERRRGSAAADIC